MPSLPVFPEAVYCLSRTLPTLAGSSNDVSKAKFASVSLPGPADGLLEGEEKERGAGEESEEEEEGTAVVHGQSLAAALGSPLHGHSPAHSSHLVLRRQTMGLPGCSCCPPPSRMSRSVGEMTQSASSSPGEGATFEHLWNSL